MGNATDSLTAAANELDSVNDEQVNAPWGTRPDVRCDVIKGLRDLADFLETHPDIPAPTGTTLNAYVYTREQIANVARMASWVKEWSSPSYFSLRRSFGAELSFDVFTDRSNVCRPVVTGQRIVPAQPAVDEHIEDVTEWICDDATLLKAGASR